MTLSEILRQAGHALFGPARPTADLAEAIEINPRKLRRLLAEHETMAPDHGALLDLELLLRRRAKALVDIADEIARNRRQHCAQAKDTVP